MKDYVLGGAVGEVLDYADCEGGVGYWRRVSGGSADQWMGEDGEARGDARRKWEVEEEQVTNWGVLGKPAS